MGSNLYNYTYVAETDSCCFVHLCKLAVRLLSFICVSIPSINCPLSDASMYHNYEHKSIFSQIHSPFAGYISLFDSSTLENSLDYNYSINTAILLTPTEFSLDSLHFIIANINPSNDITSTPTFVAAGEVIGGARELSDQYGIHVEAYKTLNNIEYSLDPTKFIPPVLDPVVDIEWDCNEITTLIKGVVVDTQTISKSDPIQEFIGDPLINLFIPYHEFPQPYDLILEEDFHVSSTDNVEFFQSSTFLVVGVIPVTFSKYKNHYI